MFTRSGGTIRTIAPEGTFANGLNTSPIPVALDGRQARKNGTSAPRSTAMAWAAAADRRRPSRPGSTRMTAAASLLPPPSPAPKGTTFFSHTCTRAFSPKLSITAFAARAARLEPPPGTFSGPETKQDTEARRAGLHRTVTRSCSETANMRLSSKWYPSSRRPVMRSVRLTLAGASTTTARERGAGAEARARRVLREEKATSGRSLTVPGTRDNNAPCSIAPSLHANSP